jgi:hypothetical protein
MNARTKKVMINAIQIREDKLRQVISEKSLVVGLWGLINAYGVEYNKENHEELVEIVQTVLVGSEDIEMEWTERQYDNFVVFDPNLLN